MTADDYDECEAKGCDIPDGHTWCLVCGAEALDGDDDAPDADSMGA